MKGNLFILVSVLLVFVAAYLVWQPEESDSKTDNQIKNETSSTQNETFTKNTSMVERKKQTSNIQEKKQIKKTQLQHPKATVSHILDERYLTQPEPEPELLHSNTADLEAYTERTYEELTPQNHHITVDEVDTAFENLDQKVLEVREKYLH